MLAEALDATAVGERLEHVGITSSHRLSCGRKREVIDAYLLLLRSKEELVMLEEDAKNCVQYYKERQNIITMELKKVITSVPFEVGRKAMLHHKLKYNDRLLSEIEHTVSVMQNKQPIPSTDSSDDSDDDADDI